MKAFNLNEAVNGKPVRTRDGKRVDQFIHVKSDKSSHPCLAVINGVSNWYSVDGEHLNGYNDLDLFMSNEAKRAFLNIYCNKSGIITTGVPYYDRDAIPNDTGHFHSDYVKTIEIVIEK